MPAKWTAEQIETLNEHQKNPFYHPYTCGNDSTHPVLIATPTGWMCSACSYRQVWAHGFPKLNPPKVTE